MIEYKLEVDFKHTPTQDRDELKNRNILEQMLAIMNEMTLAERVEYAASIAPGYRRLACFLDVGVFIHICIPETLDKPFGKHHYELLNLIPRGARAMRCNVIAPRYFAKTTVLVDAYSLHSIVYKDIYQSCGLIPENYIVIISRAKEKAKDSLQTIRSIIEDKYPSLKGKSWGQESIITSNYTRVKIFGVGSTDIRGTKFNRSRPSLILSDDLDDANVLMNPRLAEQDMNWFREVVLNLGSKTTNFINVDTIKGRDAITAKLEKNPLWRTKRYAAIPEPIGILHPEHEDLWEEYGRMFVDLTIPETIREEMCEDYYQKNKLMMEKGVKETWSELITYKEARRKAFAEGLKAVLQEQQNVVEERLKPKFKMDRAIRFEYSPDGILRSDGKLVRWNQISGATVFLDYAGAKDEEENCFAAVVTVVWEPLPDGGRIEYRSVEDTKPYAYVFDAWLDRGDRSFQINALIEAYMKIQNTLSGYGAQQPVVKMYCEGYVQDKFGDSLDNTINHFNRITAQNNIKEELNFKHRRAEKIERILKLDVPILNGWLAFHNNLSKEFMEQMSEFNLHLFNDGPDALEGAYSAPIEHTFKQELEIEEEYERMSTPEYEQEFTYGELY